MYMQIARFNKGL